MASFNFAKPVDPRDEVDLVVKIAGLEPGEVVSAVAIEPSADATAAGVQLTSEFFEDDQVGAWFAVAEANREDAGWSGAGQTFDIKVRVTTSNTPPRVYEKTGALTVRQL